MVKRTFRYLVVLGQAWMAGHYAFRYERRHPPGPSERPSPACLSPSRASSRWSCSVCTPQSEDGSYSVIRVTNALLRREVRLQQVVHSVLVAAHYIVTTRRERDYDSPACPSLGQGRNEWASRRRAPCCWSSPCTRATRSVKAYLESTGLSDLLNTRNAMIDSSPDLTTESDEFPIQRL